VWRGRGRKTRHLLYPRLLPYLAACYLPSSAARAMGAMIQRGATTGAPPSGGGGAEEVRRTQTYPQTQTAAEIEATLAAAAANGDDVAASSAQAGRTAGSGSASSSSTAAPSSSARGPTPAQDPEARRAAAKAAPAAGSAGYGGSPALGPGASAAKAAQAPPASSAGAAGHVGNNTAPKAPSPAAAAYSALPPADFLCGRPAPTNLRIFAEQVGAFDFLDKGMFNVMKGAKGGSRGVKVKRAYFGALGTSRDEREPTAVKILNTQTLLDRRKRVKDDNEAFQGGDYSDIECAMTEIGVYRLLAQQERQCEHIVRMCDVFTDQNGPETWLVLKYCEHGDLIDYIQARMQRGRGACDPAELRRFVTELFQAVGYMHGLNIGHRDISPENLLLSGPGMTLKLMDFGQACLIRPADDPTATPYRYFRMTAKDFYRSPEQYIPPPFKCPNLQVPVFPRCEGHQIVQLCQLHMVAPQVGGYHFCEVRFPDPGTPGQTAAFCVNECEMKALEGSYERKKRGSDGKVVWVNHAGARFEWSSVCDDEQAWCLFDADDQCCYRARRAASGAPVEDDPPECDLSKISPSNPASWVFAGNGSSSNLPPPRIRKMVYAQLVGYEAAPVDVFACGGVILTLHTGTSAWRNATLGDPGFKFLCQMGLDKLLEHWNKPLPSKDASLLLRGMLMPSPSARPSIETCMTSKWLTEAPVATAPAAAGAAADGAAQASPQAG